MSANRILNLRVDDLKEHPQANLVPDMDPDMWEAFLEDIRVRGVTTPIKVCRTRIIDGRNRVRAYKQLHVELIPCIQEEMTDKEQLDEMIKAALLRRHLNESQRAMLAARLKPAYAKAASAREKSGKADPRDNCPQGRAADQAGDAVGVSGKSVQRAEKVIANGSAALQAAVVAGEVPVSAAAAIVELPKAEQTKAVKNGTVSEVAKEVKETKKYADKFETEKYDKTKPPKNGRVVFDAKPVNDLFGKIVRAIDKHEADVGAAKPIYKKCRDAVEEAFKAWKELSRA